jgi:hypothetical protein
MRDFQVFSRNDPVVIEQDIDIQGPRSIVLSGGNASAFPFYFLKLIQQEKRIQRSGYFYDLIVKVLLLQTTPRLCFVPG